MGSLPLGMIPRPTDHNFPVPVPAHQSSPIIAPREIIFFLLLWLNYCSIIVNYLTLFYIPFRNHFPQSLIRLRVDKIKQVLLRLPFILLTICTPHIVFDIQIVMSLCLQICTSPPNLFTYTCRNKSVLLLFTRDAIGRNERIHD